jgi:hypothetical protein
LIFYVSVFSITLKPPSVQGLFAFCSLGMLHSDLTLAELALKELMPYKDSPEYVSHIAVFKAYTHFLQVSSIITVKQYRKIGSGISYLCVLDLLLNLEMGFLNLS